MSSKYYITWDEFHQDVKTLAKKLGKGRFNKIIAISRGGLLPAGILAYELDIRNSQAINVSSYDNNEFRPDEKVEIDCMLEQWMDKRWLLMICLTAAGLFA